MIELFIFFTAFAIIFRLISYLIFKFKGSTLGCFSTIFTILMTLLLSMSIAIKLNPLPDESFFNPKSEKREIIDKKQIENGLQKTKLNNDHSPLKSNYLVPKLNHKVNNDIITDINVEKIRTGAICNDGSYSDATGKGACSHHGGVQYWLYE